MRFESALVAAAGVLALLASFSNVHAQAYPAKPLRMIVNAPPGGLPDILGRAIINSVSQSFGQPVVAENRPGANGNIAMDLCAKAPPDGYTICIMLSAELSINPFAYEKLPFDPRDFVPVVSVARVDSAINVHSSVPANSVQELAALARAKPGAVTWASLGNGSTSHLLQAWFGARTGVNFLHVPYKGSPPALAALVAGEVMVLAVSPGLALPHVKAGKVRAIGTMSGDRRSPLMPDVPTIVEQGFDLDFRAWFALFFPKGTPAEPVRRWNSEVNNLLADRGFTDKFLAPLAATPMGGSPEDLAAVARASRRTAEELVKVANLKFE